MPASIRLMRTGKKSQPNYRVIVVDKRKKRDGAYIEKIGYYNPLTEPATIEIKKDRLQDWLSKGAVLSEGMVKLLKIKTG